MNKAGIITLVATLGAGGLLIIVWLIGLVAGVGGGLIHLLLVMALLIVPIGTVVGVVLIIIGKRESRQQ
ncbi:MAG TPA: DUF5670 family protein [Pyrinomonadaceae bacterium]|jgi:hypothetical protein